jgi:hypothetical protein
VPGRARRAAAEGFVAQQAGGVRVLRTNRLGAQFGRAAIWGGSNVASFFAYHLLPLADAVALTFAAPLFLTALSWPIRPHDQHVRRRQGHGAAEEHQHRDRITLRQPFADGILEREQKHRRDHVDDAEPDIIDP